MGYFCSPNVQKNMQIFIKSSKLALKKIKIKIYIYIFIFLPVHKWNNPSKWRVDGSLAKALIHLENVWVIPSNIHRKYAVVRPMWVYLLFAKPVANFGLEVWNANKINWNVLKHVVFMKIIMFSWLLHFVNCWKRISLRELYFVILAKLTGFTVVCKYRVVLQSVLFANTLLANLHPTTQLVFDTYSMAIQGTNHILKKKNVAINRSCLAPSFHNL